MFPFSKKNRIWNSFLFFQEKWPRRYHTFIFSITMTQLSMMIQKDNLFGAGQFKEKQEAHL